MKTNLLSLFILIGFLLSFDCVQAQYAMHTLYRDTTTPIPKANRGCVANTDTEQLVFDDIKYHRFDDFQRLMGKGIDINLRESRNCDNLLTLAVIHDNAAVFNYLMDRGADYTSYGSWGNAACSAAQWGRTEFLGILLDKGVSPDSRTVYGSTLLHLAVSQGKYDTVKLLLERKARTDIKSEGGETVLERAKKHNWDKMAELLIAAGAK